MIKISTIFVLGILVVLVQYTGFPLDWKNFLYIIFGLSITVLSFLIRKELDKVVKHLHTEPVKSESYSENSPM